MKERNDELYERCLRQWGEDAQMRVCIEEMSELTQALCKYMRVLRTPESEQREKDLVKAKQHIIEETADVMLMAEQMRYIFGKESVDKVREYKKSKIIARLDQAD